MITINGKEYRNIQEQVEKNKDDIEDIKAAMPYPSNEYYTKTETDNKFYTRSQVEGIITTKTANFLDKSKYYEDDDNPREVYFRYPIDINQPFVLIDSQDDTHHPGSSGIIMRPTSISIEASSSNHGDLDIDYVGGIQVNDGGASAYTNDDEGNRVYFPLTKHRVKHDMLLYIVDSNLNYGVVHMIFIDNYDQPYDYAKIYRDWRSYIYPEVYYRTCNSQTFDNVRGNRVYVAFYIDNSDELWFEEQDDFYSGNQYTEESGNSYKVLACNDKISIF